MVVCSNDDLYLFYDNVQFCNIGFSVGKSEARGLF